MRILLISILGLLTLASCTKQEPMEALIDRVFTVAEQQYTAMDTRLTEKTLPRTLSADGEFVPSNIYWWCSGFYPGSLWYIYEYTRKDAVKTLAEKNTLKLDSIQYVTRDHDVGFQLNCSYGNAFRLTRIWHPDRALVYKPHYLSAGKHSRNCNSTGNRHHDPWSRIV